MDYVCMAVIVIVVCAVIVLTYYGKAPSICLYSQILLNIYAYKTTQCEIETLTFQLENSNSNYKRRIKKMRATVLFLYFTLEDI